jgi:transposase InsO family protein
MDSEKSAFATAQMRSWHAGEIDKALKTLASLIALEARTGAPMAIPQGPNQRWSLDFLSDAFIDGRRFRILAVVDDFTRECLALVADTSLGGRRVVRELEAVIIQRGRPVMCV